MKHTLLASLFLLCGCSSHGEGSSRQWSAPASVDILFSGDFMQHLKQINAARRHNGAFMYDSTLMQIAPFWQSADFAVINLETTLAAGEPYTGYPKFRAPREIAFALKRAGITHCVLANNHALDNGLEGVKTTIETLNSAAIAHTGVRLTDAADSLATVLYLYKKPFKIALLNYTYGTNGLATPHGVEVNRIDTLLIKKEISTARKEGATHIVAFMHWGNEYERKAAQSQIELGNRLRHAGVDVVVGSHPHVVQEIDAQRQIVYSLGNFVSNQREMYRDRGINVRLLFFEGHKRALISYLPHYVNSSFTVIPDKEKVVGPTQQLAP